ncbi:uncharacterized protein LOC129748498 [Uranotaenia lowii]|uniref:uncharacterized protein LOC129748498 n=1 Tax=Uranotaenia lowii TaxID=190385 RepID=UPI002478B610|nr:uncharacterized protein LOC129748498 [Uranotaenia lowii]XP_055599125.1 uncharacterized protein LOC129748498 [Uranotaenia lowii]
MFNEEEVDLDDTHLCNKCGRTVIGLEQYIKHRKVSCIPPKPATVTVPSEVGQRSSEQGYSSFDYGESIKEPEHPKKLHNYNFNYDDHTDPVHRPDSKNEYKSEVNYDYELGADLFFSSLELQSSSKKPSTSTTRLNVSTRVKTRKTTTSLSHTDPEPEHEPEDVWIEPQHEKLMKAVRDISGHKKVESLFPYFHHESPDPSDDESEEEEDFDAPPRTHTGGKWKPENRPSSSQWRHWPDREGQLDKSLEQEDDDEYKSFSPPPGHTKGKWVPGSKITRLEYKTTAQTSKTYNDTYWCSICNRKLASRFVYERHLKSNLHMKRAQEETELERAVKPTLYPNELSKRMIKPSIYLGEDFFNTNLSPEKTSTPTSLYAPEILPSTSGKVKRKRKCYYTKCEVCKTRLPSHLLGKHLISRYHYRRMLNHPEQCFDIILKNIHRIVLQSPFQCHPCKFYANTQEQFMNHWRSPGHDQQVSDGGKFWCSFCKFECPENYLMTNHLQGADHQEVIAVINRSVPIIIRKISPIICEFCGDEFRYNAELKKHHEFCNEGTPDELVRIKRTFQNCFTCDICKASFHNKMLLLQHGQKLHRLAQYYCSICEVTFATPKESVQHRRTTAHKVMSARKRQKVNPTGKICHVCKQELPDKLELKNHIHSEHPETKYSCPQCAKSFVLPQELGRHVRDKNCTFFNPGGTSSHSSALLPGPVFGQEKSPEPSSSLCLYQQPSESGPNSIITNDSIKVNMANRKTSKKESHLYVSAPKFEMNAEGKSTRTEELVGQIVHGGGALVIPVTSAMQLNPTVTESDGLALESQNQTITVVEHYTFLQPSIPMEASEVIPITSTPERSMLEIETHNFLAPNRLPQRPPTTLISSTHCITPPKTTTTATNPSHFPGSDADDDDADEHHDRDNNIIVNASTSAEIFFTMASSASENNTVYVDEIVGTTTDDGTIISWQCKICPFSTSSQAEFLYHRILHDCRVSDGQDEANVAGLSKKLSCPLCKKQFTKSSLRCHLRQHTNERIFPCSLCPMSFTRKANLKNHVNNIHRAGQPDEEVAGGSGEGSARNQVAATDPVPPSICGTCGKTFANSHILTQHEKIHLAPKSIKEFACQHPDCYYVGRNPAEVRTHLACRHSEERNFACNEDGCDYRGKTISQLKRHYQRHDETVKKYKCEHCDFATRISGHLKRHLLVHSGKKPYWCPHCDYVCNNIENLRKHVISTSKHKGKFLYECQLCRQDHCPEESVFKVNFWKDFKNHLIGKHKLSPEDAAQVARI